MPANRFGINLAEIYRDAEALKGAKTRNALSAINLSETERMVAERPEKERIAAEHQNRLTDLREQSTQGDVDAQKQLLAIDPEGGASFIAAVDKMGDRERETVKKNVEEMGSMTATILNAAPERRPSLYSQMLTMLPEATLKKMPTEYDENFLELSLAKGRAMDDILNVGSVKFGGQNILTKGGREVERADIPVKAGSGGAGGSGTGGRKVKSSDESLMYKQAASFFGGFEDPVTGKFQNLTESQASKVQTIAAHAARLFRDSPGLTINESVALAGREFGISIDDLRKASDAGGDDIQVDDEEERIKSIQAKLRKQFLPNN